MELVRNFKALRKGDIEIAGGKGASLGEMINSGIPVPEGFVILSNAFERFIEETDLNVEIDSILHKVKHEDINSVEKASEEIKALILSSEMPKDIAKEVLRNFKNLNSSYVAVRSSATSEDSASAAWAGQLDTYLNTTEKTLLENVKKCWASLFTPRAIFYRFEKGLHKEKVSVAVVVQKMVESEISGIAFSVHPVTEDRNQLIIEAGYGLGEAIVSGQITPDNYVVEKTPRRIIDKNISNQEKGLYRGKSGGVEWKKVKGEKQKLNDKEILELSELILKIEEHYSFPVDIEWAREKNKFYIVQSRPITTLSGKIKESINSKFEFSNYVRMFAGQSFYFLLTNVFLNYYKRLGVVCAQDEESWMSFLPKKTQEKTLIEGKKLYTTKSEFYKYNKEFKENMANSSKYFESALSKGELSSQEVEKFLNFASSHFSFYSKTEFFYTDLLDKDKMVLSVEEFDKLKMGGRVFLNKMLFEDNGYINSLMKVLSKQTGIFDKDLLWYSIDELLELIESGKEINKNVLEKRKVFFASEESVLFSENSRDIVEEFLSPFREISNIIKGKVANNGKAKAKARVFNPDFHNFDKISETVNQMEKGEILVAETTSPEIVAACKKASAIITNQGGMLSHAAIISRELGIPCIIGADKDVILNIKTGDVLDLNANGKEGIVRILKQEKNQFELEFSRETSIGNYYIWLYGYIEACRILGMDMKLPEKTFAIYENGIAKGYTQKGNIDLMKKSIVKLSNAKLTKILTDYIKEYSLLNKSNNLNNKEFMKKLVSKFVISFILGDMNHPLQKKALEARIKTEKLFYSLSKSNLYKQNINSNFLILTKDNTFSGKDVDIDKFLDKMNISISEKDISKKEFSELVHLDFPLSLVELHYEQESASNVPWAKEKFTITPYIFYERRDNLTYLFYDVKGIDWQIRNAGKYEKEGFVIKKIKENYDKIKDIIEKEKVLNRKELLGFLKVLRELWPWLNYMWWAIEYKEKNKLPIEELIKIRKYTEHFTPGIISVFKKSLEKIYPEKRKYVEVISLEELEKDIIPDDKTLANRIKYYAYTDSKMFDSVGEIFNKYNIRMSKEESKGDLSGQVAYPGKVKGNVRIIERREDIKNFKKGEILVASTTTPDYLPAMKLAKGIISEHGGAISHAAITSRELKIPCIVGVKGATKCLKTGDEIELDAEKGVVIIL